MLNAGLQPIKDNIVDGLLLGFPYFWDDSWDNVCWDCSDRRKLAEKSKWRKSHKKEHQRPPKRRKVVKHHMHPYTVFPIFCGSRGSKNRLAKVAGVEPSGEMRDEQFYTVVARRRFRSQNANTSLSKHCWKLAC